MIYSLAYYSTSCVPGLNLDSSGELMKILRVARSRNRAAGVTGALLFNADRFVQVIEGSKTAVDEIFASIQRDPRHSHITVFMTEDKSERHFETWSMGFAGRSAEALKYYLYLTRQLGFRWEDLDNPALCQMIFTMMNFDRMGHLSI